MPPEAPESEAWFDEYVQSHGHDPGDPEPDLGIEKNPDRRIIWNDHEVICEIKQFESHPFARVVGSVGTLSMKQALNPVRRKVSRAAEQLKPLAESDWPLVVVLANPTGQPVPFSTDEILWALFGDPIIQIPINTTTGAPGPAQHTVGRNSRLLFNHQYLSAVVALRKGSHRQDWHNACWERTKAEQRPEFDPSDIDAIVRLAEQVDEAEAAALTNGEIEAGDYLYTEVFTAVSETATPLPRDVFDGPRDTRWDYDAVTENYQRTRG